MIDVTEEVLAAVVGEIVGLVDPVRVLLFGSRARGAETDTSDIDLLIVVDRPFNKGHSRRAQAGVLYRRLARFDAAVDILLYSRAEYERWRHARNHVIARAAREGRILHERS